MVTRVVPLNRTYPLNTLVKNVSSDFQIPIMHFGTAQVKLLVSFARRHFGPFVFETFSHRFHHFGDVSRDSGAF